MELDSFFLALRVVVGTVCLVSIGGATLIIVTFIAFKDLRTLARQQLVNLSIADILVAGSHFIGLVAIRVEDYDSKQFQGVSVKNVTIQEGLCVGQAAVTMCGTIASFLWSLALGFYMLTVIVLKQPNFARYLLLFYYPVCWLVPLALSLLFVLMVPSPLGYAPESDIGWCYGRVVPNNTHAENVGFYMLGYGFWFCITIIALVVIYFTMLCYLKFRNLRYTRGQTDFKLVLVPLIFFLLRVWSVFLDYDTYEHSKSNNNDITTGSAVLSFFAGIGDSSQGLANAILFCVFTKQVRERLKKALLHCFCCCCLKIRDRVSLIKGSLNSSSGHVASHETTTQLDTDSMTGSHRTNPLLTPTERDEESDKSALLKAAYTYNGDPFKDGKYGTAAHNT